MWVDISYVFEIEISLFQNNHLEVWQKYAPTIIKEATAEDTNKKKLTCIFVLSISPDYVFIIKSIYSYIDIRYFIIIVFMFKLS